MEFQFLRYPFIGAIIFLSFLVISCERDVDINVPGSGEIPVVEGWIEPGMPPIVILTRSKPYFGQTNFSSLDELFIHNAVVTVSDGSYSANLIEICTDNIPDSLLPLISSIVGVDSITLASVNYCIYSTFDAAIYGQLGKNYSLSIQTTQGENLSSVTAILDPVPLDSLWFEAAVGDTLGFMWARLSDPPAIGNCYRWFTKRLSKDANFVAPMGSAVEDKFFNGTTFNFGYSRGDNDFGAPEPPGEKGYFKVGDTVVVKFASIDNPHYQFWRTFETQIVNNGNPFAAPAPVKSNIDGGALGVWGGYSPFYDTLIIEQP